MSAGEQLSVEQFVPNQAYPIPVGNADVWVVAGQAERAHLGQDAGAAIIRRGAFAVCDGARHATYEGERPDAPQIAAQEGSRVLAIRAAGIDPIDSWHEANSYVDRAMNRASQAIVARGGSKAAGAMIALTANTYGEPHLVLGRRGDVRVLGFPLPEDPEDRSSTLQQQIDFVKENPDNWVAAQRLERMRHDGALPYDIFNEDGGHDLKAWIGDNGRDASQITETRYLPLKPGIRHRFSLTTDAVFGNEPHHYMDPATVKAIMEGVPNPDKPTEPRIVPPQQAAEHLVRTAKKHDDRYAFVLDVAVVPRHT